MKAKTLLIYYGRGVSLKSYKETLDMCLRLSVKKNWHVQPVSADILNYESWGKEKDILIIPGGRETPYHQDLYPKGQQKIKDFVASGGSYLGICAGAYYGAAKIIFEKGNPEYEIITTRSLGLYTGCAEGPAYGLGLFQYSSEAGARVASVLSGNHLFNAYFNGGCWFHSHQEDNHTKIIARYADLPNQPAAVVKTQYGKGLVCLSGVHFEYTLEDEQQSQRNYFIEQLEIFN